MSSNKLPNNPINNTPSPKVCRECPFRINSSSGWLGDSGTPEYFINAALSEDGDLLECHLQINYDHKSYSELKKKAEAAQRCRGAILFSLNSCKDFRNEEKKKVQNGVRKKKKGSKEEREGIFKFASDMARHHKS